MSSPTVGDKFVNNEQSKKQPGPDHTYQKSISTNNESPGSKFVDTRAESVTNMSNPTASPGHEQTCPVDDTATYHDFSHIYTPAPVLSSSRYNRQMLIPSISLQGQKRILAAKVLIIGLGGLGSPASLYLAGAGIGLLGLLDDDVVELSNLHRQIVHREESVTQKMSKVASCIRGCRDLNSEIELVGHELRFAMNGDSAGDGGREKREEILRIVERYDIVLDCTDNPATRYLISDLCVLLGKTLVSGAAQRLEGQVFVLNYRTQTTMNEPHVEQLSSDSIVESGTIRFDQCGPCYRCVFPTAPSPDTVRGCGEIGILGPVVGTIGTLMASETLRLIVKGVEKTRKPTMLLYNAWPTDAKSMFRTIGLRGRRKDCLSCGDDSVLAEKGLRKITKEDILETSLDYVAFCGLLEDVHLLKAEQRMDASDFLNMMGGGNSSEKLSEYRNSVIIDTREPSEVAMGPKLAKSLNIPLTRILRQDRTIDELEGLLSDEKCDAMLFVCHRGNDSQFAAQKLLDTIAKGGRNGVNHGQSASRSSTVFIGDIEGGYVAIERVVKANLRLRNPDAVTR